MVMLSRMLVPGPEGRYDAARGDTAVPPCELDSVRGWGTGTEHKRHKKKKDLLSFCAFCGLPLAVAELCSCFLNPGFDGKAQLTPAWRNHPAHGIACAAEAALHVRYILESFFSEQLRGKLRAAAGLAANDDSLVLAELGLDGLHEIRILLHLARRRIRPDHRDVLGFGTCPFMNSCSVLTSI